MPPWLARLLFAVAQNPKKATKIAVGALIGAVSSILLVGIIAINMIAALFDYTDVVKEKEDLSETELYQVIDEVHQKYIEQLTDAEKRIYDAIKSANTYYTYEEKEITNEDGETEIVQEEVEHLDISIFDQVNMINYAYYLSYIHYSSEVMWNIKYEPDIKDLDRFTRTISTLTVQYDQEYVVDLNEKGSVDKLVEQIREKGRIDDEIESASIENKVMTPQEVDDYYFPEEPEHQEFLVSFDLYLDFLDWLNIGNGGVITDPDGEDVEEWEPDEDLIDPEAEEIILNVPAYYQDDYHDEYGGGTIAAKGCGPTCLAMIVSYTTGTRITPPEVAAWAGDTYYVPGAGSSWSLFYEGAKHYGTTCQRIGKNADLIVSAIMSGRPVIASMGPGTFTKGGHFIVIIGFTKDGYFIVNDPNKGNVQKYNTKKFSMNTVMSQAKAFWAFG